GGSITFRVVATGVGLVTYRWFKGLSALTLSSSDTLTLSNVQLSDAGTYNVEVCNGGGCTFGSAFSLGVENPPPISTQCAPLPAGLVSWWQGDDSARDRAGRNHGALVNGLNFAPGEVGRAFNSSGEGQEVSVPASASLDVGAGSGMTIEGWIKPADATTQYPLAEWNSG